jgi:hypothetical protein
VASTGLPTRAEDAQPLADSVQSRAFGDEQVRGHVRVQTRFRTRACNSPTKSWLLVSDTGSAAASDLAAALMLATSELLASTG